jgi:Fe2+ transport system protein FeoA
VVQDGCCQCQDEGLPVGAEVALTGLKAGQRGVVRRTDMDLRDAALLRAMGLRPNARVRLCRLGEPCIVEIMGARPAESGQCPPEGCCCRIGLARPLADRVMVAPLEADPVRAV